MDKDKKELYEQYVALDQLGAIIDRIQRYQKVLFIKDEKDLTDDEKIWLLTFNGLNLEFKAGTEESTMKGGQLAVLVESIIPETFK
jgi:hypothetical protein